MITVMLDLFVSQRITCGIPPWLEKEHFFVPMSDFSDDELNDEKPTISMLKVDTMLLVSNLVGSLRCLRFEGRHR